MTSQLIFVRHGATLGAEGRCIGHTDLPLSEVGAREIESVAQTEALIRRVSGVVPITQIVCSDLQRATQSAFLMSRELGVQFTMDARLREMHFGDWDGAKWSDLELQDGPRVREWMEHWSTAAAPGGETVAEMALRVESCIRELKSQVAATARSTIVVAHAGSIRLALCHLLHIPHANMFDIKVEHAHTHIVDLSVDGPKHSAANVRALR